MHVKENEDKYYVIYIYVVTIYPIFWISIEDTIKIYNINSNGIHYMGKFFRLIYFRVSIEIAI